MKEIWKDVPGYEGEYTVSSHGRVKSFKGRKKGRVLSLKNCKGWYLNVILLHSGEKRGRSVKVHSLVVEVFLGIKSSRKIHIHHMDGNKQNNTLDNLFILTARAHSLVTVKENPGFVEPMRKWNQEVRPTSILQFDLHGNFIAEHTNSRDASKASGVCQRNILQVANKDEYKPGKVRSQAGGFIWKLKQKRDVA